jgi:IS605 OrfB family transposase
MNLIQSEPTNTLRTTGEKRLWGEDGTNPVFSARPWLLDVPKGIRQQAAFEAHKNFKLAKTACRPKVRGCSNWCISLEDLVVLLPNKKVRISRAAGVAKKKKKGSDCIRFMGRLHPSLVPETHDESEIAPPCQVQLQKMNHEYYLLFPFQTPKTGVEQTGTFEGHGIGLDPGMRKFVTGFGTDGRAVFFGAKNPGKKFVRMQWYKDLIDAKLRAKQGSVFRATGRDRKRLRVKRAKMQERMNNIRSDFHHKVANWITTNYKVVALGKLPKHIISRDRHLPKVVKRAYNALAHFKFRCCLADKCAARGVVFTALNEAYTSKTCTLCGYMQDIGSKAVYTCSCCPGASWDRDVNGARNILLKSISESYLRIAVKKDGKTLSLGKPLWTQNPRGFSFGLDILCDSGLQKVCQVD